jgi:gingipain R
MNKKKLYPVLFVVLSVLTLFSYSAMNDKHVAFQENRDNTIQLNFTLSESDYQIIPFTTPEGQTYSRIVFNRGIRLEKKGAPEVPFLNAGLRIAGNTNVYYRITDSSFIEIELKDPLVPSRGTIYRNQDPMVIPYIADPQIYRNGLYPLEIAGVSDPFCFRDTRGVFVTFYPFQYDAGKKVLRVYTSISMNVVEKAERNAVNSLPERALNSMLRSASRMYETIYLNYIPETRAWPGDEIEEKKGDILVIHTSRDTSAIAPYVTHKQSKGFTVHTQLVTAGINVKATVKNAYTANTNILYVQLVGDWADIKCDLGGGASAPMDPMLGCVVGTDSFPDIIIGRFSAASATDVTTQVNKAIYYETHMNESWWKKGLGIASAEGSGDDDEYDKEHIDIIKENKLLPKGFTSVAEAYDPGATAAMVSAAVNPGCFIINYCGHGAKTYWVSSGFSNTNVNALTNTNMYPIIWSVACVVGEFHTSGDCFAEAWLKKQNGGAVATLMSTINQPWVPPMIGQDYFNDLLIGGYNYAANPGDGTSTTKGYSTYGLLSFNGLILMYSEDYSSSSLQTMQTWTLFGDSSLQVRGTSGPQPPVADFTYTTNGMTVTFTDKSTDDGTITKWAWNFGNGTTSTIKNPTCTYSSAKTYTVVLTVTDNESQTASKTKSFFVGPQPPYADFIYTTNNTTAVFTDKSTDNGTITKWNWTFLKNGSSVGSSTLQNPSFNYNEYGIFQAKLDVTDNENPVQTGTITKNVEISQCSVYCESKGSDSSYEYIDKITLGTYSKTSGNNSGYGNFTTEIIELKKGNTYPISLTPGFSSGSYTEYFAVWIDYNKNCSFEDTEKVFAPAGSNAMVSGSIVVPANAVTGKTRIRISMKYNAAPTACETLEYGEVEDYSVNLTTDCETPVACFTPSVNKYTVTFTNCSTSTPNPIVTNNWNFGDNSTSTLANPVKTYAANGTYNVTLTVTNACGKTASISKPVIINVSSECLYDDIVGSFPGIGIWLRDSQSAVWTQISKQQADYIRLGDVNGNGLDDMAAYFKATGKLWYRYDNGIWEDIPASAATLVAYDLGDMNNDGKEDLVGSWSDKGLWWRNNTTGVWTKLSNMIPTYVATGDFNGDNKADVVGLFPSLNSIWIYYSNNTWKQISKQINIKDLRAGNMDSDAKAELVGSWDIGVWMFDPETNNWVKHHAAQAKQIAVGDINAQCMKDIVGYWDAATPLYVKLMESNTWVKLSNYNPDTMDAGKVK